MGACSMIHVLRNLHPEEEFPARGLEFENVDTVATRGGDTCRGNMLEHDVVGKDDQIVNDVA